MVKIFFTKVVQWHFKIVWKSQNFILKLLTKYPMVTPQCVEDLSPPVFQEVDFHFPEICWKAFGVELIRSILIFCSCKRALVSFQNKSKILKKAFFSVFRESEGLGPPLKIPGFFTFKCLCAIQLKVCGWSFYIITKAESIGAIVHMIAN